MLALDASSMIHAWDNYPPKQFPPLWNWIASQIEAEEFSIPKVALDEIEHKLPDCATWLKNHKILRIDATNEVFQEAMRIKQMLEIQGDKYHAKGVDEIDILIVATASCHKLELVSDEARQVGLPQIKAKMKIPAVCNLGGINVPCLSFLELIKRSSVVFG